MSNIVISITPVKSFAHPCPPELEVRQQTLEKGSPGPTFCGPVAELEGHLDCISVPQQRVQDLHDNGRSNEWG